MTAENFRLNLPETFNGYVIRKSEQLWKIPLRLEILVPRPLKPFYRRIRSAVFNRILGKTNTVIFDNIYKNSVWGSVEGSEICSGSGTYDDAAKAYIDYVKSFIIENDIASITEIGCGDFSIAKEYSGIVDSYTGYDASSIVVRHNIRLFRSPTIDFVHGDASEVVFPPRDLCIIRQVLQHLDNASIVSILKNVSNHRFVMISEHLPAAEKMIRPNIDKLSGPDTRLPFGSGVYVELPPFSQTGDIVLDLAISETHSGRGETVRTTLIRHA